MAAKVTIKGQVTLPKSVRDAAGIRSGDRVSVRLRPEGGVIVEAEDVLKTQSDYKTRREDMRRRRPIRSLATEAIVRMSRGED